MLLNFCNIKFISKEYTKNIKSKIKSLHFSKNGSLIVLSNSLTILGFYLYHPIIIKYHEIWNSLWKSMKYWNKQQCSPLPFNQFDLELYTTCTLIFWLISPLKYHQSCERNKKICAILYSFLKQNIEIQMFWDNKKTK